MRKFVTWILNHIVGCNGDQHHWPIVWSNVSQWKSHFEGLLFVQWHRYWSVNEWFYQRIHLFDERNITRNKSLHVIRLLKALGKDVLNCSLRLLLLDEGKLSKWIQKTGVEATLLKVFVVCNFIVKNYFAVYLKHSVEENSEDVTKLYRLLQEHFLELFLIL